MNHGNSISETTSTEAAKPLTLVIIGDSNAIIRETCNCKEKKPYEPWYGVKVF